MGFFTDLIKKEAKKLVSDVVDNTVGSTVKKYTPFSSETSADNSSVTRSYSYDKDNEANDEISEAGVRERIEKVFVQEWNDYEVRRNIPAYELNCDGAARNYSYGLYKDGQPKVMIMVLTNRNHFQKKDVVLAHNACCDRDIPCINIMSYLPSTMEYISERLKEEVI